MNSITNTINNYNFVSNEIKYFPRSVLRLKILNALYEKPMNMSGLNKTARIEYSAISNNLHRLELNNYIFRKNSNYYLTNEMKLYMDILIELDLIIDLLERVFPIMHNHIVKSIPIDSICTIKDLESVELLEDDDLNINKTQEYIKRTIIMAKHVNAILPFFHEDINNHLNKLLNKNISINLLIPLSMKRMFHKNLNTSNNNLKLNFFNDDEISYFLLICTDNKMVLGLFKEDGSFDQNRLLVSNDEKSIVWANTLFEAIKKENSK